MVGKPYMVQSIGWLKKKNRVEDKCSKDENSLDG